MRHSALAPAARTAHPADNVGPGRAKLTDAAIDCAARQPGRLGGRRHTTIVLRQCFVGREQPPAALIKMHRNMQPALANVVDVDHLPRLAFQPRVAPRKFAILSLRSSGYFDSLVSPQILSGSRRNSRTLPCALCSFAIFGSLGTMSAGSGQ